MAVLLMWRPVLRPQAPGEGSTRCGTAIDAKRCQAQKRTYLPTYIPTVAVHIGRYIHDTTTHSRIASDVPSSSVHPKTSFSHQRPRGEGHTTAVPTTFPVCIFCTSSWRQIPRGTSLLSPHRPRSPRRPRAQARAPHHHRSLHRHRHRLTVSRCTEGTRASRLNSR